ncbi:MAG: maleylpyruvate isomerase family mycothiol-dependent enzyme [Actinobacteria bacterium]|nr:maleylpyruvate isomerase family mycothiol-dependent enzyme [Actinomycetota bacterium]MBO0836077.1 maleylpyruvate isomerase family mycothiol-dependent enzyme [Actinomycetota bacterium]
MTDPEVVAQLLARVNRATERVQATAAGITDQLAREPSLLPGWSRGHVLTHIARNADGLRNLLIWARTGVVTPQYPSAQARNAEIEDGAGRPGSELAADVASSAAAFAAEAARLGNADWDAEVRGIRGAPHPAWFTLWRRLSELEIHHLDLAAGYQPADWPTEFAREALQRVTGDFTGPDSPAALLRASDHGTEHRIGPPEQAPTVTIDGPSYALLAWLLGRSDGNGLLTTPTGPLPPVPPW